jgi:hypothetical protein
LDPLAPVTALVAAAFAPALQPALPAAFVQDPAAVRATPTFSMPVRGWLHEGRYASSRTGVTRRRPPPPEALPLAGREAEDERPLQKLLRETEVSPTSMAEASAPAAASLRYCAAKLRVLSRPLLPSHPEGAGTLTPCPIAAASAESQEKPVTLPAV